MGFREDIETILTQAPEKSPDHPLFRNHAKGNHEPDRQLSEKILFWWRSNKSQVALNSIEQFYYDIPTGRKNDALGLLLHYYAPSRSMVFCNTKKMVDDLTGWLLDHGFKAEGLHGDMKQSQRTVVMDAFKAGRTSILVATDVAARGIDVDDINCVFNYDIPQNAEYYVHRIGRTGRAGKSGSAYTLCCGRNQLRQMEQILRFAKAQATLAPVPMPDEILQKRREEGAQKLRTFLTGKTDFPYLDMVLSLMHTEDEKVHITMRHLIPKQMRVNGVKENEVVVEESAVRDIIRYYTREAGVRSLERAVGKILRKIVLTELEAPKDKRPTELPIRVTAETLEKYLGVRRFSITSAQREPQVGIVNGLSWSEVGGDILMIEAVAFPGKGQVLRTGMLGDVMKESVEAARSVVRARAKQLGLKSDIFANTDWHIHFPEGAIPKDGPSAGAAIVTAMTSALTGIPVRSDLAMTGEITLRGEVLPIGGLKEKLLAAQQRRCENRLDPRPRGQLRTSPRSRKTL